MTTAYHANRAKQADWNGRQAKSDEQQQRLEANAQFVQEHPTIGTLVRGGRPLYYTYTGGAYRESRDPRALTDAPLDPPGYAARVAELEDEGMDTSDAQAIAHMELR